MARIELEAQLVEMLAQKGMRRNASSALAVTDYRDAIGDVLGLGVCILDERASIGVKNIYRYIFIYCISLALSPCTYSALLCSSSFASSAGFACCPNSSLLLLGSSTSTLSGGKIVHDDDVLMGSVCSGALVMLLLLLLLSLLPLLLLL